MAKLTDVQREILEALVRLYEKKGRMVKSKEVAELLGKDEGTVRNIIMWLKGIGFVTSRAGPAGGYAPTLKAYEYLRGELSVTGMGYAKLIIESDGLKDEVTIVDMEIMRLLGPGKAKALVRLSRSSEALRPGAKARVESAPSLRMIVKGVIEKAEPARGEALIAVDKLIVIPDVRVGEIASRNLIVARNDMTVREVARLLHEHGIRGAPIVNKDGKIEGFITTSDIAALVAFNMDLDAPVSRYVRKNVFTINENEGLTEAMRLMDYYNVGRLVVLNSEGKPVGIVTRTDILRYIAALE
ncbi:CBS domain-containing protein [Stetteria hydrogenophila]